MRYQLRHYPSAVEHVNIMPHLGDIGQRARHNEKETTRSPSPEASRTALLSYSTQKLADQFQISAPSSSPPLTFYASNWEFHSWSGLVWPRADAVSTYRPPLLTYRTFDEITCEDRAVTTSTEPARRVSARLAAIQESATLAVDAKAKALKAAGRPVVGFGAGEPDFPTPAHIVEAAAAATHDPKNHKYSPAAGLPELRKAISEKTLADSGVSVDPSSILVTNGGKQAVYQAFAAITDPGDEIILPAPYWTTYPEAIRLCDGVPVEVYADAAAGYKVSVDQLEEARTARTKALLVCSPSNPTGAMYSAQELTAIGQWALEHGVWVITDEIYEHLTYGKKMNYILSVVPELANQTIVLNGVAKTYSMTGWRVGWMYGPKDVIKAATNMQSHTTSNVANVSQRAAIAALTGPQDVVEEMRQAFERRRDLLLGMLRDIDGVVVPEADGAFYLYPDVTALLGRDINGKTAHNTSELAAIILEEAEVAAVPGEAFGKSGCLRFSYALADADIVEGISRIQKLFA